MTGGKRRALALLCWIGLGGGACVSAQAEEYVAFSLGAARAQVEEADTAWRTRAPEVFSLAGISRIYGLVYDREGEDVILVGQRIGERPGLTLDDFAVALRARLKRDEWPLVSIDPMPDGPRAETMQRVRYEGGIEETAFGMDMFDADLRLKKIGFGLLESGAPGLKSTWEGNVERILRGEGHEREESSARCWFYPISPPVGVREDVVAIEDMQVGVFTEVMWASFDGKPVEDIKSFVDPVSEAFADEMRERYWEVAAEHRSVARLAGLNELVGLTRAIERMEAGPDLSYWMETYRVKEVATPREQEVLRRRWEYQRGNRVGQFEMSGGVHLTAVAMRLEAGDVTALREAVLETRPAGGPLSWAFSVGEWGIVGPVSKGDLNAVAELYAHGEFLFGQRKYDLAIAYWRRVLRIMPELGEVYYRIGLAFERKGLTEAAADYYNRALALDPFLRNVREF